MWLTGRGHKQGTGDNIMEITYALSSFPGDRERNEDYALAEKKGGSFCFAVADGLGGHEGGDVASKLVCEAVARLFVQEEDCPLGKMYEAAQEQLLERQRGAQAADAMKTTLNVVVAEPKRIRWGHIGDTRTYHFKRSKILGRTKDHSVPQMMVEMGEIREQEIRHHEDRNRLLRVMGVEWASPQYVLEKELKPGRFQAFLICTDGFWEYIEDREMEACLKGAGAVREWLDAMNEIVRGRGAGHNMDNYTALAVWIR